MTELSDLPIRDALRGRTPYGAPQLEVPVALNVNENTHGVPQEVIDDILLRIGSSLSTINRYPDREFSALRIALAKYLGKGLTPEQIWAANGSNEVIQQIFQAFGGPGRSAMGFEPTYSMYRLIAQGTQTEYIDAPRAERYVLTPELASAAVIRHQPDITLLCSPNNPTGTPLSLEVIKAVYDATEGIVLVDEAYAEFAKPGTPTALDLLEGRPRLLVSRTMSKAFAFAGARLGYLAGDPAAVDALRLVRLPYHLSALTQAAAEAALSHSQTMLAAVAEIRAERDHMVERLKQLGFDPYESDANFVLFGGVENPEELWQKLLDKGVLVRNVGIPNTLRVTAGTKTETEIFLESLAAALNS